jgi:glycosyltransferase involved in cell wall biosynthesis
MNTNIKKPLVSIVIPTYNRELFIQKSLESALNQNYSNIEIIVTDNCSTDSTNSIVENYLHDNRIIHLTSKFNSGPVKNWEKGICAASGKYLKILFSDELIKPDAISTLVDKMIENDLDISFSPVTIGSLDWIGENYYQISNNSGQLSPLKYLLLTMHLGYGYGLPVSPSFFVFDRVLYTNTISQLILDFQNRDDVLDTGAGIDLLSILYTIQKSNRNIYFNNDPLVYACAHSGSITHARSDLVRSLDREARMIFCNSM